FFFFFFSSRRRHTRCLSDWSSDVCSSDLVARACAAEYAHGVQIRKRRDTGTDAERLTGCTRVVGAVEGGARGGHAETSGRPRGEIGRASCRERVEVGVVAVAVKKKR